MKSNYEIRATKFAALLVALFANCSVLDDFVDAVESYNMTHSRPIRYDHGVSRFAVLRADYVIKFDMVPQGRWENGIAGNNKSEARVYEAAKAAGFEYLLAKTTVINMGGRTITIMPKVDHVNDWTRDWSDYCTEEEFDWLEYNINDLHEGNVGYRNGKVCVIDYAWEF